MAKISAKWTGKYPSLCCGKWIISVDGIGLTGISDDEFQTEMEYETKRLVNNYSDVEYTSHSDGLSVTQWIKEVKENDINGLYASLKRHGLEITDNLLSDLYYEIHNADFRYGTCGGCL